MKILAIICITLAAMPAAVWAGGYQDQVWENSRDQGRADTQIWRTIEESKQRNREIQQNFERQNMENKSREIEERNRQLQRENDQYRSQQTLQNSRSHGRRVHKNSFEDDGDYRNW